MSSVELQKAIALIKSGKKEDGQKILVDIVKSDPQNDKAWLWLASIVSDEKQIFCLEKALSINPNNTRARQYLEKVKTKKQPVSTIPSRSETAPETNTSKTGEQSVPAPIEYWTVSPGKLVRFIILENTSLTTFEIMPETAPVVLKQLGYGTFSKQWYEKNIKNGIGYKTVHLKQVHKIRLLLGDIAVYYYDKAKKERSITIRNNQDEVSDAIIDALEKRLGEGFVRISKENSRLEVAGRSLILLLFGFGITGFCYWGTLDLVGQELRGRYSGILSIFQIIGPTGVLYIGIGIIILLIFSVISQFAKPPMETVLVRRK